jgi:hypothetical protein
MGRMRSNMSLSDSRDRSGGVRKGANGVNKPIVLSEWQAGVAIEGVVRHEALETAQLAVDTTGTPISP